MRVFPHFFKLRMALEVRGEPKLLLPYSLLAQGSRNCLDISNTFFAEAAFFNSFQ